MAPRQMAIFGLDVDTENHFGDFLAISGPDVDIAIIDANSKAFFSTHFASEKAPKKQNFGQP